ncbi:hypothetical protein NXH64_10875 [Butyrivibrio fibrisolvens]|uniref:hypothetical protein n=1 Tax=Pseudobutyrivibrio ruminis TaxID=46206 RepID=UPI0003FD2665|nr:hypothetical protein [Pseudobutyrivibrio ruminis]MDC7280002.1 hypothetical protein [Butyrivibrio fibrisolvens]
MNYIDYFKSQAKKFYKDFQTQYKNEDDIGYSYNPKYWLDIEWIIASCDIDENNFSLMKAQHIIAILANFESWNELIHSNECKLELGYYLIENREGILLTEWQMYENWAPMDTFDDGVKLNIFKHTFLEQA